MARKKDKGFIISRLINKKTLINKKLTNGKIKVRKGSESLG